MHYPQDCWSEAMLAADPPTVATCLVESMSWLFVLKKEATLGSEIHKLHFQRIEWWWELWVLNKEKKEVDYVIEKCYHQKYVSLKYTAYTDSWNFSGTKTSKILEFIVEFTFPPPWFCEIN